MRPPAPALRTYSHLASERRIPKEYEIVTTRLLHHLDGGFEVTVPIAQWYDKYSKGSRLTDADWECFYDPRETTYAKYTNLQAHNETFVSGVLQYIDDVGYDVRLAEVWLKTLDRIMTPSRYFWHGLQMIVAYIGQMVPSGRITIACAFQAADEMRRIQRISYRMRQLQDTHPSFGKTSRTLWQSDPAWQPLREVVEQLLVTYDWSEAVVALNLAVKPLMDDLLMSRLGAVSWHKGDPLLAQILFSLNHDCQWHRDWSDALFRLAVEQNAKNHEVMLTFLELWYPRARRAAEAIASVSLEDPAKFLAECDESIAARLKTFDLSLPRKVSS